MKNKQQQFINAWEDFLNDIPDTNTHKQDDKNDLSFTEICLMFNTVLIIILIKIAIIAIIV